MKIIKMISVLVISCAACAQGDNGILDNGSSNPLMCNKGTDCPSQCCWANVCADVDENICADHGVTPDECGKCVDD